MRKGLKFGKRYAFRNTTLSPASSFSQSRSSFSQSFGQRFSLGTAGEPPKKRESVDAGGSPFKRSRSNSQSPDKAKRDEEINSQTTSLYTHNDISFDNCIFSCLVISPAGRAIRDSRSIRGLLKAPATQSRRTGLGIQRERYYTGISQRTTLSYQIQRKLIAL